MTDLICSISGIRGIVGRTLTPDISYRIAEVFYRNYLSGKISKGNELKIVIGRDPKKSGIPLIKGLHTALKDIMAHNRVKLSVYYLGVTSTPAVEWAVSNFRADAGIMVTASHNPIQWNGIKFISDGRKNIPSLLYPSDMKKICDRIKNADLSAHQHRKKVTTTGLPKQKDYIDNYCRDIVAKVMEIIDRCYGKSGLGRKIFSPMNQKKFRVVIDAGSGQGAIIPKIFLNYIGITDVIVINCSKIEDCKRPLEPLEKNLIELKRTIRKSKADVGFAIDPDGDRLVTMPASSEEDTPLLAAKFLLELQKLSGRKFIKKVVINTSTSRAWEDLGEVYGIKIIRSAVGEINVVSEMRKRSLVFGAEGNGGVILGSVNYGRNSAVGIALIMAYLSWSSKTIKKLDSELPEFYMLKKKVMLGRQSAAGISGKILDSLKRKSNFLKVEKKDGYKFFFKDDSWLQVRPSNTEPIMRIFAEVRGKVTDRAARQKAEDLINSVKAGIRS
ncbi:MAG: hypothetical protein AB1633_05725 [Elusimicrobiota bacterium]